MNNLISTKVSAYRNLKNYKFLPKLSSKDKEELVNKLVDTLGSDFELINKSNYQPKSKNIERVLSYCEQNVLVKKDDSAVINLFGGELIEIIALDKDVNRAYQSVKTIADLLASKIELAYSDQYGYLMSDVTKIGSGYHFEANINLNALLKLNKIGQLKQNLMKLGYKISETDFDSIYKLSSTCNLGYSEHQAFEDFQKMIEKLDSLEQESAKMLDLTNHDEILDRIRRSEAILASAYVLDPLELVEQLNYLRLGLDLSLTKISCETINNIQDLIVKTDGINTVADSKELASKVNKLIKGE